jgi:hypothetical protein
MGRRTVWGMNRGEAPVPRGAAGRSQAEEPVHSITGAVSPLSDDLDARIRRYLISMSIRVLCVILAIVIHARWHHWSWWIFAVGAVILPYVAVVMANAVGTSAGAGATPVTPQNRFVLPSAPTTAAPTPSVPTSKRPDEGVVVTIHPPERPIDEKLPDSGASERTFAAEEPRLLADSRPSSEQSR